MMTTIEESTFNPNTTDNKYMSEKADQFTDDEDTDELEMIEVSVEEDTFSLMMFSPFFSILYFIGIITFLFQALLVLMLFLYLLLDMNGESQYDFKNIGYDMYDTTFNIPIRVNLPARIGQYLVAILSIALQSDIQVAIQYLSLLRTGTESLKILQENQVCYNKFSMLRAVYFPNLLRFLQGVFTLTMVTILIVRNNNFLALLMNFTALYVISEVDNVIFKLIRRGFFPCFHLARTAAKIEEIDFEECKRRNEKCSNSFFLRSSIIALITTIILGVITYIAYLQDSGYFFNQKYPLCEVEEKEYEKDGYYSYFISDEKYYNVANGVCDGKYNLKECGWDGGDCEDFNLRYSQCKVEYPLLIGNGKCDGGEYNTFECNWDGLDCEEFNAKYPNCTVQYPSYIGDGVCDGGDYNTEVCGWDGSDCDEENERLWIEYPDCRVEYPSYIGDGHCNIEYNTTECGWDGYDCTSIYIPPIDAAKSISLSIQSLLLSVIVFCIIFM